MKLAVLKETRAHEARVAATPETVKKLIALGLEVVVEKGAGAGAAQPDAAYREAGASIAASADTALKDADLVLGVQRPEKGTLAKFRQGARLFASLNPFAAGDELQAMTDAGIEAYALELIPRITRAQSMDILSSQASLAGYRAVLEAAFEYGRALPQMMTAAGTIQPARALIMGAGVAGLQAIATARRLGARVSATDVRPATKEQVKSLGAEFLAVEDEEFKAAEAEGGYAKQMSEGYQKKQNELIAETLRKMDIVITTALIPGRPAPVLVTEEMVKTMKPGAVIVDLAVEQGGNCPLSKPGKTVEKGGVKIIGPINLPSRIAADASQQLAKNYLNFLTPLLKDGQFAPDMEDEIVKATRIIAEGRILDERFGGKSAPAPAKANGASEDASEGASDDAPADNAGSKE